MTAKSPVLTQWHLIASLCKQQEANNQHQVRTIWSAFQKLLKSLVEINQRSVEVPFLGKFAFRENKTVLMPSLELLTAGHFSLQENDRTLSPLASHIGNAQTISLSSIAATSATDKEQTAQWLKRVLTEFIKYGRQGALVELNLGCGSLVCYPSGALQFGSCG
jgi:hypothetical protein